MVENSENKAPQEQQGRSAARAGVQHMTDAAQKGAATLEQTGRGASEALRRGDEVSREAIQHMGHAASDTARRSARDYADAQKEFVEDAASQVEETMSRLAQVFAESAQEWRAIMQLPGVTGGGLEDIQRSVSHAVEGVIRTNLHATRELFRIASPATLVELQQRFMREYLSALLEGSTQIIHSVRRVAEQTLPSLEQRLAERQEHTGRRGNGSRVADVMERDVRIASPEDTVQQVARLMREEDTGALPVGEGDRLVGMVTDRDVAVRLVAEGRDPARTKVRDVMTPEVRYVFEDEDLDHVAEDMAEQQVRRLPVVNRQKRLVGVVSLGDIAQGRRPHLAAKALRGVARPGGMHTQTAAE